MVGLEALIVLFFFFQPKRFYETAKPNVVILNANGFSSSATFLDAHLA